MYRYAVEILRRDGTRVGQREVVPDLSLLVESMRLTYLRRRGPEAAADYDRAVEIEPIWHSTLGEPYVGGFACKTGGETNIESTAMFRAEASRVSGEFIKNGELEDGESFVYLVTAYPDPSVAPPALESPYRVRSLPVTVPVSVGSWTALAGASNEPEGGLRVAVPRHVVDEVSDLTVARRGVETGGVLIGYVRWDPGLGDLYIEVTEQIYARHAEGDATSLHFTPDCWTTIRATLALRNQGESILGWWHSHPARGWCAECPRERQQECPLQKGFLSDHDKALHRTVFSRTFMSALVATDSVLGSIQHSMFGWRSGVVDNRGFHTIDESSASGTAASSEDFPKGEACAQQNSKP